VPGAHVLMHGPVARAACSWCHAPHESAEPALLKNTPIQVCTQCHDQELLGANPPEHVDGTTSCLQCHFGHGGDARYFLKPRTPPASPPAEPPTSMPAVFPLLHLAPDTAPVVQETPATRPEQEPSP
jgi:predicted CXXCH cytochrome family protein